MDNNADLEIALKALSDFLTNDHLAELLQSTVEGDLAVASELARLYVRATLAMLLLTDRLT